MKVTEFKVLKDKLEKLIENKHITYSIYRVNYILHDNNIRYDDTKNGIIVRFGNLDVSIIELNLYGLKNENGRSRFTDSKELSYDFFNLTLKQKDDLIELMENKV